MMLWTIILCIVSAAYLAATTIAITIIVVSYTIGIVGMVTALVMSFHDGGRCGKRV